MNARIPLRKSGSFSVRERLCPLALCLALVPLAGFTEVDGVRIYDRSLEMLIDAPTLVGKRVRVSGVVYLPALSMSFLKIEGGTVVLQPPWKDRGDFRKLIPTCEADPRPQACAIAVEGTLTDFSGEDPILTDVDFLFSDVP